MLNKPVTTPSAKIRLLKLNKRNIGDLNSNSPSHPCIVSYVSPELPIELHVPTSTDLHLISPFKYRIIYLIKHKIYNSNIIFIVNQIIHDLLYLVGGE